MSKWQAVRVIWRGAVGGSVGMALLLFYFIYRRPDQYMAISALHIIALVGAAVGVIIALIILTLSIALGRNLHVGVRAFMGAGVIVSVLLILVWHVGSFGPNPGFVEGSDTLWVILDYLALIVLAGVLPGVFARPKRPQVPTS